MSVCSVQPGDINWAQVEIIIARTVQFQGFGQHLSNKTVYLSNLNFMYWQIVTMHPSYS